MDNNVLASLTVCKQQHRRRLIKKKHRRRHLLSIRRILLDTTYPNLFIKPLHNKDIPVDDNLKLTSLPIFITEEQNEHSSDGILDLCANEESFDDLSERNVDEEVYYDLDELNIDEQVSDVLDESFNLATSTFPEPDLILHGSTNITKNEYCRNLLTLFRDAKISKTHCDRFIRLIQSGLPIPNNMPTSMKNLLQEMQVEELFLKRSICTACNQNLNHHNDNIKCNLTEEKFHADIYDIDVNIVFYQLIDRLWPEIIEYKQQLASNSSSEYNDIPLNALYRNMISRLAYGVDFVSLIFHLDGISLCKSSKLTMWLLSGIFIELPPDLRYRRHNMILLSIWIGYSEPKASEHIGGRGGKRQYYSENHIRLRDERRYELESIKAVKTSSNVYGHLGRSILHDLLDVPLPHSIIVDYLHVSLLRHTKSIVKQIYKNLSPLQRTKLDTCLRSQKFPHFFNRTFGQEDFIGAVGKNYHGTRFHGQMITYHYEIDFALRNRASSNYSSSLQIIDGPLDKVNLTSSMIHDVTQCHLMTCSCDKPEQCIRVYRRCMIDKRIYHSLIYSRRNSTVSFFIQYNRNQDDSNFGKIRYFFTSNNETFAVIEHHEIKNKFSQFFNLTSYYDLLRKSIDSFFYVLYSKAFSLHYVPITSIRNHCIIFEMTDYIIVTPISVYGEHD
ncbi:unnamed protein product [Rotaria sordida]|uniref:Uncharacterized protein n=1 Tax=Rotaria sordida TaxID=392033 RepID=A0A815D9R8_9BILA|nr:unnamed protein product [Rotaria sordida]